MATVEAYQTKASKRYRVPYRKPGDRKPTERGWFAASVRRADVPPVTPHNLRHTAAPLAVSAGANAKAVQRMIGHASAAMTLDVYADLFDDDLDGVAVAMDRARSLAVVGK